MNIKSNSLENKLILGFLLGAVCFFVTGAIYNRPSNGGGGDTIWTNAASALDEEGGPIYSFKTIPTFDDTIFKIGANYISNYWGESTLGLSIGLRSVDLGSVLSNNTAFISIGDRNFQDTELTHTFDMLALGSGQFRFSNLTNIGVFTAIGNANFGSAVAQDSFEVTAIGTTHFASASLSNVSDVVTVGQYGFNSAFLNNVSEVFGIGLSPFLGSVITNCLNSGIYGIGSGSLSESTLENVADLYAIGIFSGTSQTFNNKSHIFMLGSGSKATNSNDFVIGDNAYNYFFPGASMRIEGPVSLGGSLTLLKTITGGGTTGNQTINKICGSVNFAASAQSITVQNSFVSTSSVIIATVATDDSTAKSCIAVPGSSSFLLKLNAAATAETRVQFLVIN